MRSPAASPRLAAAALLLGLLACRPVFAIGWEELLAIVLLTALLLGPLLWRLARGWDRFQQSLKKERKDH
jgi:hypothetical protein